VANIINRARILFLINLLLIVAFIYAFYLVSIYADRPLFTNPFAAPIRWQLMPCTGEIVGPGQPGMVRVAYAYTYGGQTYTSTRYSLTHEEMPEWAETAPIRTAFVNADQPSESVLSRPKKAFRSMGVLRLLALLVPIILWLTAVFRRRTESTES
jgi:hypothetical protein